MVAGPNTDPVVDNLPSPEIERLLLVSMMKKGYDEIGRLHPIQCIDGRPNIISGYGQQGASFPGGTGIFHVLPQIFAYQLGINISHIPIGNLVLQALENAGFVPGVHSSSSRPHDLWGCGFLNIVNTTPTSIGLPPETSALADLRSLPKNVHRLLLDGPHKETHTAIITAPGMVLYRDRDTSQRFTFNLPECAAIIDELIKLLPDGQERLKSRMEESMTLPWGETVSNATATALLICLKTIRQLSPQTGSVNIHGPKNSQRSSIDILLSQLQVNF